MEERDRVSDSKKQSSGVERRAVKRERPAPPKPPAAPSEENIKETGAMPDLDQFNFHKW